MALQQAVQDNNGAAVKDILRRSSYTPSVLQDALTTACRFGRLEAAKAVVESDSGGLLLQKQGTSLLHDACIGGHATVASLLISCGVDPEGRNSKQWCPCHTASYHGEVSCLEVLAGHRVDLGMKDPQGQTPCHLAAERNNPSVLDYLGHQGFDLEQTNVKGQRPVHLAAKHGALECLIIFTQMDCDTNAKDGLGRSPAHYAAGGEHIECLRFLLHHGANRDIVDKSGKTLAHLAAAQGAMSCLHWLLEKNPEMVNIVDRDLNTPAHLAAAKGHAKCFHCCLQHDADLTVENNKRETPIGTGRRYGHPLRIEKACKNEVQCNHCKDTAELLAWEKDHQPSEVQRMMKKDKKTIFTSPLPKVKRGEKKKAKPHAGERGDLPKRDLVARYVMVDQEGDMAS